jgi:hypothetical protein
LYSFHWYFRTIWCIFCEHTVIYYSPWVIYPVAMVLIMCSCLRNGIYVNIARNKMSFWIWLNIHYMNFHKKNCHIYHSHMRWNWYCYFITNHLIQGPFTPGTLMYVHLNEILWNFFCYNDKEKKKIEQGDVIIYLFMKIRRIFS